MFVCSFLNNSHQFHWGVGLHSSYAMPEVPTPLLHLTLVLELRLAMDNRNSKAIWLLVKSRGMRPGLVWHRQGHQGCRLLFSLL